MCVVSEHVVFVPPLTAQVTACAEAPSYHVNVAVTPAPGAAPSVTPNLLIVPALAWRV